MATLASQPYAGLSNEDVMRFVVDHRRVMEMPTGCPPRLYELMVLCWRYEPKERPTFAEIEAMLLPDMSEQFLRVSRFHPTLGKCVCRMVSFQVSYYCTQRGREPPRSSHAASSLATAPNSSSGNGGGTLSSSPAHTGDSMDAADPETPLNPRGCEDGICETSLVDIPGADSDSEVSSLPYAGLAKQNLAVFFS